MYKILGVNGTIVLYYSVDIYIQTYARFNVGSDLNSFVPPVNRFLLIVAA